MNSRLIELYKEASEFAYKVCQDEGRTGGPSDHIWNALSTGKFAELIVRECASVELYWLSEQDRKAVAEKIREHFGIDLR